MNIIRSHLHLIIIIFFSSLIRIQYLFNYSGDLNFPNLGGDPCHHYNSAYNFSKFFLPQNDFIFSYWFRHESLPALIDIYPPGFYIFLGFFLFLFGDSYFVARIFNFLVGILNITLTYLIGLKIKSKNLAILSSLAVSINIFHIENSTVVMNVVFSMLVIQISILSFLLFFKGNKTWFFIGFLTGISYLTYTASQVILFCFFAFLIIEYYYNKILLSDFLNKIIFLLIGYIMVLLPWAFITYEYFGNIFYSNMNYYPFTNSFSYMMFKTTPPSILDYLINNISFEYFKTICLWTLKDIINGSLYLTPTLFFIFSFLLFPFMFVSFYYGDSKIRLFLIIFLLIFIINIIGSTANNGILWPRHYVPLLSISSFISFFGMILFYEKFILRKKLLNLHNIIKPLDILFKNKIIFIFLIFIISLSTSAGLIYKENYVSKSFWNREHQHFYNFGTWIENNTAPNSTIMYGLTPQDAWCATNRKIVGDPTFRLSLDPKRAQYEVDYYNVDYLWIDLSSHIYDRNDSIDEVLKLYRLTNLKLLKEDKLNGYYFYEIYK